MENKLPIVHLVESARCQSALTRPRFFVPAAALRQPGARGILQVCIVRHGSIAGGAYLPGPSDYVMARPTLPSRRPAASKAATGEIATDEELGGAEMHGIKQGRRMMVYERC